MKALRKLIGTILWNLRYKKKSKELIRDGVPKMLRGSQMQRLGGRLRIKQEIGKRKHQIHQNKTKDFKQGR